MAMTNDGREEAVLRLKQALAEQDRLTERHSAAIGTSREFGAYVRLRGAGEDVAARDSCVKQIDDDGATGGRVWINGRQVGGPNSRFLGLDESHD